MKKNFKVGLGLLALAIGMINLAPEARAQHAVTGVPFEKVVHLCGLATGSGSGSGRNYSNCKGFADGDLYAIEANTIITAVEMVVDTSITGTTALVIGDDDDADGFATDVGSYSAGYYFHSPALRGVYLRSIGNVAGISNPALAPAAGQKYYSAAGKEIKLDVTTANTAGKARVIIKGIKLPAP